MRNAGPGLFARRYDRTMVSRIRGAAVPVPLPDSVGAHAVLFPNPGWRRAAVHCRWSVRSFAGRRFLCFARGLPSRLDHPRYRAPRATLRSTPICGTPQSTPRGRERRGTGSRSPVVVDVAWTFYRRVARGAAAASHLRHDHWGAVESRPFPAAAAGGTNGRCRHRVDGAGFSHVDVCALAHPSAASPAAATRVARKERPFSRLRPTALGRPLGAADRSPAFRRPAGDRGPRAWDSRAFARSGLRQSRQEWRAAAGGGTLARAESTGGLVHAVFRAPIATSLAVV